MITQICTGVGFGPYIKWHCWNGAALSESDKNGCKVTMEMTKLGGYAGRNGCLQKRDRARASRHVK